MGGGLKVVYASLLEWFQMAQSSFECHSVCKLQAKMFSPKIVAVYQWKNKTNHLNFSSRFLSIALSWNALGKGINGFPVQQKLGCLAN